MSGTVDVAVLQPPSGGFNPVLDGLVGYRLASGSVVETFAGVSPSWLGGFANVLAMGADPTGTVSSTGAFLAAAAAGSGLVYLPAGKYLFDRPVTVGGMPMSVVGGGKTVASILIAHSGTGILFDQTGSPYFNTVVAGITFTPAWSGGPSAAAFHVSGSTAPSALAIAQLVVSDVDTVCMPWTSGFIAPYPGSWAGGSGIVLENLSLVRIAGWSHQGGLLAAPALPGAGISLSNVIDIEFRRWSAYYHDTAIFQAGYCEGIRGDGFTVLGTNHHWTQASGIPLGGPHHFSNLYCQKSWWADFEINTYRTAFPLTLVSDTFIGYGEIIRYGDSGASGWGGLDLVDCYGWASGPALRFDGLVGTVSGTFGIRTSVVSGLAPGAGSYSHRFHGPAFANVANSVVLGSGTAYSQFLELQHVTAAGPINSAIDNSANVTNRITAQAFGGGISLTEPNYQIVGTDQSVLFTLANVTGAGNSVAFIAAAPGSPPQMRPVGGDLNIGGLWIAKGNSGLVGQNDNGTLIVLVGPGGSVGNFPQFTSVVTGGTVIYGVGGLDSNAAIELLTKGNTPVYWANASGVGGFLGFHEIALDGVLGLSTVQWDSANSKFVFVRSGVRVASIDAAGNLVVRGSVTASGVP